ncbi:MAG: hypothetical protein N2109_08120 [Fimbriimonadales bacterium]|nr:hypothetical protein [Fimbriimonadales bacterium]
MNPPSTIGVRSVARLFWPLAVSWLFMSLETPIAMAIVSRSAAPEVGAAGFLILMAVSIWVESPVIDLLSTSTALARSRGDFLRVRAYTLATMALVTVAHFLVAFTPLYGWLMRWVLGLPEQLVQAVHVPLQIMLPWSALIGWRRFQQGLLIRNGSTRPIVVGTSLRLATIGGAGSALFFGFGLAALEAVAMALIASVAVECLFVSWVVRPVLSERYATAAEAPEVRLAAILRFHVPLTITTMVSLTTTPLLGAAIARLPDSVRALAAWQVALTLVGLFRIVPFALPEAVIALYDERRGRPALLRFSWLLAATLSGSLFLLWVAGFDRWFFAEMLNAPEALVSDARTAVLACMALPAVGVALGFCRGVLAAELRSASRLWAMLAGVALLAVLLFVWGPATGLPGVVLAAAALTASQGLEALLLWSATRSLGKAVGGVTERAL